MQETINKMATIKITNRMKQSSFLFLLYILIHSCAEIKEISYQSPNFETQREVNLEVINDSSMFRSITYMTIYDSLLIVCDPHINPIIHIFNKNDGRFLKAIGIVGHGPGELIQPVSFSTDYKKGILYVYDRGKMALISYVIQDIMNNSKTDGTEKKITSPINIHHAYYLRDSLCLTFGGLHAGISVSKIGESGVITNFVPSNPLEMTDNEWLVFLNMYSIDAVSPDGSKYVIATIIGEIMDSYSIKESSIQPIATKYFYKPIHDLRRSISYINDETLYGFCAVFATNKYIYTTAHSKVKPTDLPHRIQKFDWNGKALDVYNCKYAIATFTIDEASNQIYAAVYKDGELAIAKGNF
jgi:hypothetical protein